MNLENIDPNIINIPSVIYQTYILLDTRHYLGLHILLIADQYYFATYPSVFHCLKLFAIKNGQIIHLPKIPTHTLTFSGYWVCVVGIIK